MEFRAFCFLSFCRLPSLKMVLLPAGFNDRDVVTGKCERVRLIVRWIFAMLTCSCPGVVGRAKRGACGQACAAVSVKQSWLLVVCFKQ